MKSFIGKIILFACIILVIDIALGFCFRHLVSHTIGGDTRRLEYICRQTHENLLIFGSSRCVHHYDTNMLEDSLQLTAYNCGKNGNGIILLYGWYSMINKRYQPKAIIYDVMPNYDLLQTDNMTYLPGLRYYYDEPGIDSIFWTVAPNERYKMMLQSYRYNSQCLQIIMDNIKPMRKDEKGYRPLTGSMTYEPQILSTKEDVTYQYDPLKLYYLERLIKDCQAAHTQLIFMASPLYRETNDAALTPIKELCRRYDLPFISHYTDSTFNNNRSYFKDSGHMNQKGATAYTQAIIQELRHILAQGGK